tara:strand:+ start:594 stop:1067 length:474 start_codon:yes stop_codon:yes gene_type:complete
MKVTRFIKKCEEFHICCNISDGNNIISEHYDLGHVLYHIGVKGVGRVGIPFSLDYKKLDAFSNNFVDVREWIDSHKIYVTDESSELYGFNSLDRNQDWDGKLIHESFTGNDRSWLICFNGKPIINNVEMQKMDYAKLENKFYDVDIKDGIVGIFTMK